MSRIGRAGFACLVALCGGQALADDSMTEIALALNPAAGTLVLEVGAGTREIGPFVDDGDVLISEAGSFVPSPYWWPGARPASGEYRLSISVPPGHIAIASASMVAEQSSDEHYRAIFEGRFEDGLPTIFAGPYTVTEQERNGVRLRTYFHPGAEGLARPYLDQAADYIDGYVREIGAYPHPGFAIVSSPLPVGLGFPGIAYVSQRILPLPFMRTRSLAHEVLHNWWGNGVWPDYASGNWSEGLTTYMADYRLAELAGAEAAREMRFGWLRDFNAVTEERDTPVRAFTARDHGASQAIGYGKVAMIFHMLRREIGDGAFAAFLRRFWREYAGKQASWDDIAAIAGDGFGEYFAQWTERRGAPDLRIERADIEHAGGRWRLSLSIGQDDPFYGLTVPVSVVMESGRRDLTLRLDGDEGGLMAEFDTKPLEVSVDPNFHLFRRLAEGEAPPILRDVMLDDAAVLVVLGDAEDLRAEANTLAGRVLRRAVREVPLAEATGLPTIAIGLSDDIEVLASTPSSIADRGTARGWAARGDDGASLLVVAADDLAALRALGRPLPHYGSRSYVVFDGPKAIDKGLWPPSPNHALRRRFD
jgi:hypothetical protein